MEERKLKRLRKHLEKQLIDCMELKKKNDLTKEGRGMLTILKGIFEYMEWEEPRIRKICKMNQEENTFWEEKYRKYVEKGIHEDILHEIVNNATKEKFPRLRDYEVLF